LILCFNDEVFSSQHKIKRKEDGKLRKWDIVTGGGIINECDHPASNQNWCRMAFIILIRAARWCPRQLRLPLPWIKMTQFEVKLITAHLPG
jgi:hypothetical protein